ncbi:hypothetical protein [Mucilaginibacter sp. PAMB04168]|uniref:hypothetical protein n=1 Tax=Mucilaginibacter sp. PAMB04168 TaxID=3138567 RepID=UPI0031F6B77D
MLGKNSVLIGLLLGLILPLTAWLLFSKLYPNVIILNKPAIPYLVALGINLLIIRLCYKKNADETGRGVMIATFACMLLFLFVFKIRLT